MAASVVCAGTTYSEFGDLPFAEAEEGEHIQVTFEQTSDMWRPFACGFFTVICSDGEGRWAL